MKKLIFITLTIIAIISISCTDDYTDPKTLSGTTWRCSTFNEDDWMKNEYEYVELRFISTTEVEGWAKWIDGNLSKTGTTSYKISADTITLTSESSDLTATGIIDNKTITMNYFDHILVLIKQ